MKKWYADCALTELSIIGTKKMNEDKISEIKQSLLKEHTEKTYPYIDKCLQIWGAGKQITYSHNTRMGGFLLNLLIKSKLITVYIETMYSRSTFDDIYRVSLLNTHNMIDRLLVPKYKKPTFCRFHKKKVGECACIYE